MTISIRIGLVESRVLDCKVKTLNFILLAYVVPLEGTYLLSPQHIFNPEHWHTYTLTHTCSMYLKWKDINSISNPTLPSETKKDNCNRLKSNQLLSSEQYTCPKKGIFKISKPTIYLALSPEVYFSQIDERNHRKTKY